MTLAPEKSSMPSPKTLTHHARERSRTRRIPLSTIDAAVMYGQCRQERAAEIYTLGWREIRFWANRGLDLSRFEGVEVVCSHQGQVITVYRNRKPASMRDRELRRAA
ncbi:MAG: DUF4258 domain-containing protein [Minicystis sp.]